MLCEQIHNREQCQFGRRRLCLQKTCTCEVVVCFVDQRELPSPLILLKHEHKWQSCRPKVSDLTFIVYRSGYLFDFEGWSRSFDLFTTQRYSNLFRGCGIICARLRCFPPSGRHRKVFGSFRRHGLTSDEASALPGERGLVWLAPTVAEWGRPNVFTWWSGTRANRGFRMADVFSGSV